MEATTERQVKREIIDKLIAAGWLVVDTSQYHSVRIYVYTADEILREGSPDLYCFRDDCTVCMEVKRPGGTIREDQLKFRLLLKPHEGHHIYHLFIDDPRTIPTWMLN